MTPQQAERASQRMQANRAELVEAIGRATPDDGTTHPLPGLALSRVSVPGQPLYSVTEPSLAVIAQGSKEVLLGASRYRYDPAHYLLTTVGVPCTSRVLEASPAQPYLSLRLELPPPSSVRSCWRRGTTRQPARWMCARWKSAPWMPICWMRWCAWCAW